MRRSLLVMAVSVALVLVAGGCGEPPPSRATTPGPGPQEPILLLGGPAPQGPGAETGRGPLILVPGQEPAGVLPPGTSPVPSQASRRPARKPSRTPSVRRKAGSWTARMEGLKPVASVTVDLSPDYGTSCVAWAGSSLWTVARHRFRPEDRTYARMRTLQRKPPMLIQLSTDGRELGRYPTGRGGNPWGGLTFDGRSLFNLNTVQVTNWRGGGVTRSGLGTVDRFDTRGRYLGSFDASGGPRNTHGLTWNGSGFYQGHVEESGSQYWIYQLDRGGRELRRHQMPHSISSLGWDGRHLWVYESWDQLLHKLDTKFRDLRTFPVAAEIGDIAWAPDGLWAVEFRTNQLHRFDVPR